VPCLLVIARWLWPLALPRPAKVVVAGLLLAASQYHLWNRLSSGSVFDPEFPRAIVMLFNWGFGAILLLAALQILLDLGTLATMLVRRVRLGAPDGLRYALAGTAALMAGFGVWNAVQLPAVKNVEIALEGLPPEFEGYQVVQLTDLHISRLFPAPWVHDLVERTNATGTDLIVVTGDFIDGSVDRRRADVEPLRELRAPDGVYAIPGNHEYYFGYRDWMDHLAGLGFRMLPNAHAVIRRGDASIIVAGVTDISADTHGEAGPDLATALDSAPAGAPVILLDHQPREARRSAAKGVALQLSGHTHGGMIAGLDRLLAPANNGFVSGRYEVGGMILYVSNGTALWPGFALRIGRPPEITRITLRRSV
jgi:predicted MPP superfamily phosphohydrolase